MDVRAIYRNYSFLCLIRRLGAHVVLISVTGESLAWGASPVTAGRHQFLAEAPREQEREILPGILWGRALLVLLESHRFLMAVFSPGS